MLPKKNIVVFKWRIKSKAKKIHNNCETAFIANMFVANTSKICVEYSTCG